MKNSQLKEELIGFLLEHLNQEGTEQEAYKPGTEDATNFRNGQNRGVLARTKGGKYIMNYQEQKDFYPPAFWKGYFSVTGERDLYTRFNNWLTNTLGRVGYSRTRNL